MQNLIDKLNKNNYIASLLNEFKRDFEGTYKNEDENGKNLLLINRDAVFRKWLFSPIIDETYLTPSYIINETAQNIQKGNYTILPHIKGVVSRDNKITFETKWLEYSETKNPVLDDLDILIDECKPVITVMQKQANFIDNLEDVLEKINFRSVFYVQYLINLCVDLNFVEKMKSINCICYKINSNYDKFKLLDNKEKVRRIVDASIYLSKNMIESEYNINNVDVKKDLLNNSIEGDTFQKYYKNKISMYTELTSNVTNINDKEMEDSIKQLKKLLGDDAARIIAAKEFGVVFDIHFSIVFSYYLGIINPIYCEALYTAVLIKLLKYSHEDAQYQQLLFSLEDGHDLTQTGTILSKNYNIKLNKKLFSTNETEDLKEAVDFYLKNKDEDIKRNLDMFTDLSNGLFDSETDADSRDNTPKKVPNNSNSGVINSKNDTHDLIDNDFDSNDDDYYVNPDDLPDFINEQLEGFSEYLINKNLKEKTAYTHFVNVIYYIHEYLHLESKDELIKISKKSIDSFLMKWYIPFASTSKTSVSTEIISINHYLKFLKSQKLISNELFDECKEISKNKDKYLDYYKIH